MKGQLRKSGIDIVGDIPWGTHFCQFYQTKEDLIDILVPYFKAGLENNELCIWVTSEPLEVEEAKEALGKAVPDIDVYLERGQIEIIPDTQCYLKENVFDSDKILDGWIEKLNQALTAGYDGIRSSGDTFWLEKIDWSNFVEYEEEIDRSNWQLPDAGSMYLFPRQMQRNRDHRCDHLPSIFFDQKERKMGANRKFQAQEGGRRSC